MQLKERFASQADAIDRAVARTGRPLNELRTLPLISRRTAWTVLIDAQSAQPVGLLALRFAEGPTLLEIPCGNNYLLLQ